MSLATEFLQDLKEGFANKDSSSVGGFVTDDFELISPVTSRPRQGFLDWVAEGGNPTTLFDVEVIYENDDVAVVYHGLKLENTDVRKMMCCGRKRDGKFYDWRVARWGQ